MNQEFVTVHHLIGIYKYKNLLTSSLKSQLWIKEVYSILKVNQVIDGKIGIYM